MTLSMRRVIALLNEKKGDINLNELFFILTVLRDNSNDDEVYKFLDSIIQENVDPFRSGR